MLMGYRYFRRILFWTFVSLFFITASLVLFYAFGYRYSFDRGIFVYSGSVTLQTIPDTVTVKIDGSIIPKQKIGFLNNSIHIAGLMPGEHFLEVSAPGYETWSKRAIISSGVSTEFWNILLTRKQYAIEIFPETEKVLRVFPEPSGKRLGVISQDETESAVVLIDQSTGSRRQVFSSKTLRFDTNSYENIEWSPSRDHLALPLINEYGKPQPVIVDLETGETIRIADSVDGEVTRLRFDNTRSNSILFMANQKLFRLTLEEEQTPETLVEGIDAYDLSGDFTYIVRFADGGGVYRFRSGTNAETLTQVTPELPFGDSWSSLSLSLYDDERFTILERSGSRRLLIYNRGLEKDYGYQLLGDGIEGAQFSNDGKKLLFYNQNEISVYFTRAWQVQPAREEGSVVQIARFSDRIGGIQWTEDYEHVLFYQNGTAKLIELDGRDRRVISDLITHRAPLSQMLLLTENNRLFFLLPTIGMASTVFPEPQEFFGQ